MGRELSAQWPAIYQAQDATSDYLLRQYLPQHFWVENLHDDVHDHHNALVIGQVALGTAVSDLVRSFAIEPRAVSGYSLGESAGLFSLQAWRDRDGMASRLRASTLFTEQLAGTCTAAREVWNLPAKEKVDWLLGLVAVPQAQVRAAIKGMKRVYLLIVNTPQECVIGGQRQAVEALVAKLGCHLLPLRGVTTVHCEVAQPCAKPYRELHLFPTTPPEGVRFYSGALGRSFEVTREKVADNILAQALETVDYPKVIEQAYADGARIFLEMGPGNSCSRMIGRILGERPHLARAACYPGADPLGILLRLLASVIAERVAVDLTPLYPALPQPSAAATKGPVIRTAIGGSSFKIPSRPVKKEKVAIGPMSPIDLMSPISPIGPMGQIRPMETPASKQVAATTSDPLLSQLETTLARQAESHAAYLQFSATVGQALSESLALQMQLLQQLGASGAELPALEPLAAVPVAAPLAFSSSQSVPPAFDRAMCMEFAIGSIAKMLGPEFAEVDSYPTRVRLPDEPLMLCDRIVTVEGEARSMSSGRVVTEHDVTPGRWYLDAGRIPTCVAVEAGQADLFLSGYLGIDFITKGLAVYRLLDAEVTFHRSLPTVGETIRYDIHIDHFFRQDQTYLFRFHFEGTVNGEPLLSMKKGCAGFFSAAELAAGKGIVQTKLDLMTKPGIRPADWRELAPLAGIERYDDAQIAALRKGDLAACFGPAFAHLPLVKPYTLPEGLLKLVDRVVELNPSGGRFGLGTIRAEADIHPDDWFLTCHFCDDHVMPGTLMYECCLHTLRIYLLRMGWIGESGTVAYEPVPGVASQLKCRGQVIESTRVVTYEVTLKELGYRPEPYAIVDALMYADGKPIVGIGDMTVRLSGLNRAMVEGLWHRSHASYGSHKSYETNRTYDDATAPPAMSPQTQRPALYDYSRILAYSVGNPSAAFGERYRVFDHERKIARLPGPPFQFLDRIVALDGEPWVLKAGPTVEAEYDVPPDAWYFAAGRQPEMPFAVLLETGLQPCGWLAAYLGSALTSPIDLSFRNLDGNAVQHRPVTPQSGTLTTRVKITRVASSGGMIIQGYDFEIRDAQGPVYSGDTVFGFFSKEALANQVGVRDAKLYAPTKEETARGESFPYPVAAPFPEKQLRMVDTVELFVPDGGPQGLGFIRGTKKVDPAEWFFKAHFYQDPVCPGSLGLESFLQLLKLAAVRRWHAGPEAVLETVALGQRHKWNYRGQIIPSNALVTIEAVVTSVDDAARLLKGDGYLLVDGKVIYQMFDFSVRLR
jgi:3-hydroxymyristoyl/3-hydroxydecanoyl-(acyl carrier protein) dehydratase/malonyl CoA-acyl carrier protein transacylase